MQVRPNFYGELAMSIELMPLCVCVCKGEGAIAMWLVNQRQRQIEKLNNVY